MQLLKKEGPVAYGEGYHKRMQIQCRLEEHGPELIQREIDYLWSDILLRTDVLHENDINNEVHNEE